MGKPDTAGAFKSFDFYQAMFEGADLYMSFWQPMLKGIGRAQLEFAQLAAKSGQSTLQYMTHLSACRSPADVMSANLKYFETLTAHHRDSGRQAHGGDGQGGRAAAGLQRPADAGAALDT